ncbi:MAG: methyltransferase [Pseudomonadota bacterium]
MTKTQVSVLAVAAVLFAGCTSTTAVSAEDETAEVEGAAIAEVESVEIEVEEVAIAEETEAELEVTSADILMAALDAQPPEAKARYDARNPGETLQFFGVEPGMTIVEALPGGGWYTKILMPYLGPEGVIVGAHYPDGIWPLILRNATEESLQSRVDARLNWPDRAAEWTDKGSPEIKSYEMTAAPDAMKGTVDGVLFVRALHNLNRAEESNGYFSQTIAESYDLLKPGGFVGVVQHRGPEANSDEWADGNAGYLKESYVVAGFEAAGFEFVGSSDINANPADVPSETDFVWRLPPSLASTEEGTPEQEAFIEIGESDRMTLLFEKPS